MLRRTLIPVFLGVVGLILLAASAYEAVAQSARTVPDLGVTVRLSTPRNGSYLVAGERSEVVVTLQDKAGRPLSRGDFATLNLYAYGPQETTKTVTASKLLAAVTDRSQTPHHYIDLAKNLIVKVEGNVLRYPLQPVTDEEPGTYTLSVYAVLKGPPVAPQTVVAQTFALADFQVGTATREKQIVGEEKCATCHLGAANGQLYLHHVDPSARSAAGSPAIDTAPVRTCKACHNNEGYAAVAGIPDPIVSRVHGVHMGEHLKNPENTDPVTGKFRNYTGVLFPKNVKDCTACHVDNRWKTEPSRQACTACHDTTWFGDRASTPAAFTAHAGGPQANDVRCIVCHGDETGGSRATSVVHDIKQPMAAVDLSMTPPANGRFYVAGEAPLLTMVIRDDAGAPIDHTTVSTANFGTASLFVSGPRALAMPVLTNTAKNGPSKLRASVSNTRAASRDTGGWEFALGDTFKIAVNGRPPVVLAAPAGTLTPIQVRDWLASRLTGVTVTATATNVTIRSNVPGESGSTIDIYDSPVTSIMGWKPAGRPYARGMTAGVTQEPFVVPARASTPANDLRSLPDPLDYTDPAVTRSVESVTYQLYDVRGLQAGTYSAYVYLLPVAGRGTGIARVAVGFMNFQVGTAVDEKKVATNCTECHGDTIWHLDEGPIHPAPFNTDYCGSCHDYSRYQTGDGFPNLGGTSQNGWSGFGAVPIVRRVHGVHSGRYLEHPEEIYQGNPDAFNEVIFPQDRRNCEKCHDARTTNGGWKTQPSRLACMACHDSDAANGHAQAMTLYVDPSDPWSNSRTETCAICHGEGRDFSVEKVHNITDPYRPPYWREPE